MSGYEYILLIIFIIAAFISYKNIVFALILLIITSCTFGFISDFLNIPLALGSISINDFIIFSLFIWTIGNVKLQKGDNLYSLILFLIFWICLSSILAFITYQITIREVYRSIFKISLFWILPITVRSLKFVQTKKIISFLIVLTAIISIVQVYAILFADVRVLSIIYPTPEAEYFRYSSLEKYFLDIYNRNEMPRLYTPGNLLVKIVFGFLLSLIFFRNKEYKLMYILPVLFLTGLFNITLGGRSDSLFILFVVLLSTFISYFLYKNTKVIFSNNIKNIFLIANVLILGFILLSNMFPRTITLLADRWSIIFYQLNSSNIRIEDTIEAWDRLIASPLWGIGRTKVHWEAKYGTYGGQDVHPFISQGLLSGFVGIILLLFLIYLIVKQTAKKIRNFRRTVDHINTFYLSAGVGILGAIMLSVINTTPVFFYAPVQVPLGIFIGILFSKQKKIINENINVFPE